MEDVLYSKNRNRDVFDSLKGASIEDVQYSDLREGEDYVTLVLDDGRRVVFRSHAPNENDITWISAEIKGA